MLKVALTGGIASGKSTVVQLFKALQTPVVDADQIARQLVAVGQPLLEQLVAAFGSDILNADGSLNRQAMRQRIFSNNQQKRMLEQLMHPAIYAQIECELQQYTTAAYVLIDIPLLAENQAQKRFDRVLVVDCPVELQRQRLLQRDAISAELADQIIASQATREQRIALASEIIDNTATLEQLAQRVKSLHNFYLSLAPVRTPPA